MSQTAGQLRPTILRYSSLPSTNTEAARQATAGAPEGLCVVAGEQTAGRGRHARRWVSPAGAGLYFSIVLRPRLDARAWPLVTLMGALAVADALGEACGVEVDIKWPNDILAGERKLCGILAEALETRTGRACILGIGINLTRAAFPPELVTRAVSVEELTGAPPEAETILAALTPALARRYAHLHATDGVRRTLDQWAARSSYTEGKRVSVTLETESFDGITRGLEEDGALRVETSGGELRRVYAGDVKALREG